MAVNQSVVENALDMMFGYTTPKADSTESPSTEAPEQSKQEEAKGLEQKGEVSLDDSFMNMKRKPAMNSAGKIKKGFWIDPALAKAFDLKAVELGYRKSDMAEAALREFLERH